MSLISEIKERFDDQCGDIFRVIGLVSDLAALKDIKPLATPAAYIFIKSEASGPNTLMNGLRQRTEFDIGIMLITTNVSDAKGAAAAVDIETLKGATRGALVGWQPASAAGAIENIGGEIVKAANSTIWWEHVVGAAAYLED